MTFKVNPIKTKCDLQIGKSFIFKGSYCVITKLKFHHFEYHNQETNKTEYMHYSYYLTTPSAAGRKLIH
jgi:hypothetical protein